MIRLASRLVAARAASKVAAKVATRTLNQVADQVENRRHPHRTRNTVTRSAVPSALVGGALMYFFDPKQGPKRRRSISSRLAGSGSVSESVNDIQERSRQVIDLATKKEEASANQ